MPSSAVRGAEGAAFALLAAILWGGGDFSGGMAVKAAGGLLRATLRVVLTAHTMSLVVLLGCLALTHAGPPARVPLLWGLCAGVAGSLGIIAFYMALSAGAMGASAALSGLLAAAIPAVVSSFLDGSPGPVRLIGFVLAAVAIWLIAAPPAAEDHAEQAPTPHTEQAPNRRVFTLAMGGGVGFGLYFVALRFANTAGVIEPMAMARVASIGTCLLLLTVLHLSQANLTNRPRPAQSPAARPLAAQLHAAQPSPAWLSRAAWLWAAGVAVLDTGGNMFYIASTRVGRLDAAAVLASLYPASTILLAAMLLHERPRRRQVFGMALALVAVGLVAA